MKCVSDVMKNISKPFIAVTRLQITLIDPLSVYTGRRS